MDIKNITAVVLAGGYSSRMGKNKAELMLGGKTLLELQVGKLRAAGFEHIFVSGYDKPVENTEYIPDVYPHRGPLSGVHACLRAAETPACLFISVDVPLIPAEVFTALAGAHTGGATVLVHGGKVEPLMSVYDCALADTAEAQILSEKTAMMKFLSGCRVTEYEYSGDALLLSNTNTPEEFEKIEAEFGKLAASAE